MLSLCLGFAIVVVDQVTKYAVQQNIVLGETQPVIHGFLNLTYLRNTGAVWGFFQHQNNWLIFFSLIVLVMIVVFYRWLADGRYVHCIAVGCMAGGISGNLIDRIKLGWVVDFLDFHWSALHWPSFNFADAAICIGVALYFASSFWLSMAGSANASSSVSLQGNTRAQSNGQNGKSQ